MVNIQAAYGVSLFSGMSQVTFVMIVYRGNWESHSEFSTSPASCSLSHSHANRPLPPSPLCPPLSCAICQGGKESTGGSFILALLTPCGDRCSWRPCRAVWGGKQRADPTSPYCHAAQRPATRDPQHALTSVLPFVNLFITFTKS